MWSLEYKLILQILEILQSRTLYSDSVWDIGQKWKKQKQDRLNKLSVQLLRDQMCKNLLEEMIIIINTNNKQAALGWTVEVSRVDSRENILIDRMHLSQDGDFQNIYLFNRTL